jgi:hypothetical protein
MPATPVYIVCSPRPQSGKTLLARVLTEFLLLKNGQVLAFDVTLREPSLLDFLPQITETATIEDTYGKIQLMDRVILNDGIPKVIDLGYYSFEEFFKMSEQIGFLKEASRRRVVPIVLYCAEGDRVSMRAYDALRRQIPRQQLIVAENEHVLREDLPELYGRSKQLRIAALPAFLRTYIERFSFSFTGYLRQEKDPSTELYQWIRRNYYTLREIENEIMTQRS